MYLLLSLADTTQETRLAFAELITPYLPLAGIVLGGLIAGLFGLWNRKRGAVETRAPDVNEIWSQQAKQNKELDAERQLRRLLEDMLYDAVRTFRLYVTRVRRGGSPELNEAESSLYNMKVPSLVEKE